MDGVAISIIGRPRPLPGHDTPNPAHNTYTLKCEEPVRVMNKVRILLCSLTSGFWCSLVIPDVGDDPCVPTLFKK